jgi:hypothetical protein
MEDCILVFQVWLQNAQEAEFPEVCADEGVLEKEGEEADEARDEDA